MICPAARTCAGFGLPAFFVRATVATALLTMSVTAFAAPPATEGARVLDVEKRRVVVSDVRVSDASPTCDVLVLGGGTGGVAAAESLSRRGLTAILVEPTGAIGGQLTSQLVCVPDENRFIEHPTGPSTWNYRGLRLQVRRHYREQANIKPGMDQNVGQCWVSRVSGTPDVWEKYIESRIEDLGSFKPRIYRRHQLRGFGFLADRRVNYADIVNLDTGRVTRIGARFFLDATEDGQGLALAGLPTTIGQEAKSEYNEPHAPDLAHPEWVQSFTYCFVVRYNTNGPKTLIEKPAEYDYFKSLGEYTLNYEYIDRGTVPYKMFTKAPGAGGPFWTYRRLVASSSFQNVPTSPENDIALINWRGNDFHDESYLGKSPEEQARILERGKQFAQGFLYWLQTECPRDDGGVGYPEMQPVPRTEMPGVDENGFALHPYIRESRRLKAKFMLTEQHLVAPADNPQAKWGEAFPDSVGCALYSVDIHPAKGEPPLLVPALPYHLPLGSFLTTAGPVNVLPAAKNFGATRLALASARMHPTEWLAGEIAAHLAAFCVRRDIVDPSRVRDTPDLLQTFQAELKNIGIPLYWSDILDAQAKP